MKLVRCHCGGGGLFHFTSSKRSAYEEQMHMESLGKVESVRMYVHVCALHRGGQLTLRDV